MPRAVVVMPAPPEAVFAVLQDATAYPSWVVGAKQVRAADDSWPRPGTEFHHTVGVGPVQTDDSTEVIEAQPPHHLRLEVRFRPVGTAVVDIEVDRHDQGSLVSLAEVPLAGAARRWWNPALEAITVARNHLSLLRLRSLATRRMSAPPTPS
jgi:hypothetical protein